MRPVAACAALALAGGLACNGNAAKILERIDGSAPPSSNLRVDAFLVRSVSSCAVGPSCTSPDREQCFYITDRSGARVLYDPDALRFVPPGDPATMGGAGQQVQCFRLVLDDGRVAAVTEAMNAFRTRVFQDSGGDINLDIRWHDVPAIDAGLSPFVFGFFLEPAALAGVALPMVNRETDFVYAITGADDPDSGLSPRVDSCSGTNWLGKSVIGGCGYTWMAGSASCDQPMSLIFSWMVQLYFGLRDVMQAPDLYDRDYPACGQGDPETGVTALTDLAILSSYAGDYRLEDRFTIKVSVAGDRLETTWLGEKIAMIPESESAFFEADSDRTFRFVKNNNGVKALVISVPEELTLSRLP